MKKLLALLFLLFAPTAFAQTAFNFPDNPIVNQIVTAPLGQTFKWDGNKWVAQLGGGGGGGGGFTPGGDLSGTATSQIVIGIQTKPVPAPTSGYLHYNGTSFLWDTPSGTGGGIGEAPTDGNAYLRVGSTASWSSGGTLSGGLTVNGTLNQNGPANFGSGATISFGLTVPNFISVNGPATFNGSVSFQTGAISDAALGGAYSGVGVCTAGQFVNGLNRNAAPSCATPAGGGGGGVTSITAGTGLTGGTITTTGTIALAANPTGGQLNFAPIASPTFTGTVTLPSGSFTSGTFAASQLNVSGGGFWSANSLNLTGSALLFNGVALGGSCSAGQFVSALSGTGALTCGTPAGGGGGFTAGGDLAGTSTSQTVIGIQTHPVPTPASGYLHFNGTVFVWDTPAGGGGGSGIIPVSDTAPASPANGQLWFNSNDLQPYIWYTDPTSSQWTPIVNKIGAAGAAGEGAFIGVQPPSTPYLGQLWFDSADLQTYIWWNDGTSTQWTAIVNQIASGGGGPFLPVNNPTFTGALQGPVAAIGTSLQLGLTNPQIIFNSNGTASIASLNVTSNANLQLSVTFPDGSDASTAGFNNMKGVGVGAVASAANPFVGTNNQNAGTMLILNNNNTGNAARTGMMLNNGSGGYSIFGLQGTGNANATFPAGSLFIQGASSTAGIVIANSYSQPIDFWSGGVHDAQFNANGLNIITGSLSINGANQFRSGTFTPVLTCQGGAPVIDTGSIIGNWWTAGHILFYEIQAFWNSATGGSGPAFVTGLPYPAIGTGGGQGGMEAHIVLTNSSSTRGSTRMIATIMNGENWIRIYDGGSFGGDYLTALPCANAWANTPSGVFISGWYDYQ